jgi:hypothetical protein
LIDQFDIGAFAGRGRESLGKLGNRRKALKRFCILTFVHGVDNLVDKTVKPDESGQPADLVAGGEEFLSAIRA